MSVIIERLNRFVAQYPFPTVHRLLAKMIIALLQIREMPDYYLGGTKAVMTIRDLIARQIEKEGGLAAEAFADMYEWTNVAMLFPNISYKEAAEIEAKCQALLLRKEDSLEMFLSQKLGLEAITQRSAGSFSSGLRLQMGMLQAMGGVYDEMFCFRPKELISDEVFMKLIAEYYNSRGHNAEVTPFDTVIARKENVRTVATVTNARGSVLVSVEEM